MDALKELRVSYQERPLAVDEQHPVFSWRMESDRHGARQEAWRITVRRGENLCWDSGRVPGPECGEIAYPEMLEPEAAYTWSLLVWNEQGEELRAESAFAAGFLNPDRSAWHGAEWIGSEECCVAAETLPVFRVCFTMRIEEGGTRAGVVFGAEDPRLLSSIHNNYLIHGENYIAFEIDISRPEAALRVFRRGYAPGEDGRTPIAEVPVPAELLPEAARFLPHEYEIVISGNQMECLRIDGKKLHTGFRSPNFLPGVPAAAEETHLTLNPENKVTDAPIFPRLCQVGFVTGPETRAVYTDFAIRHYGGAHRMIFGPETGAGYGIFAACPGLRTEGNRVTAAPGTLCWADPSFGALPMLRRSFRVPGRVREATLYAAARGLFEITVNGRKAGDEYLTPGDMDFRHRELYQAFDVTEMIREGENVIGAVLASGWYGDQTSYIAENYNFYGDMQALLAVLRVTGEDGTVLYVPTDADWQVFDDGPIRYAGNFNGETWDATREIPGWDEPGFPAEGWRRASVQPEEVCGRVPEITAKIDPGIRRIETLTASFAAKEVRGEDRDTVYLYDMGQNMAGLPEITFPRMERNRRITIRYGEILYPRLAPDNPYYYGELGGLLLTENLRGALATDVYVTKGEEGETFRPRFTLHGYRYVELSGLDAPIPAENIRGIVISSVRQTAFFRSSNPLTNQLFANIIRSTVSNHISIPTDCPQRDERLGWAGDANVYAKTATYLSDMRAFYRNFNRLQREAQGADGTYHLYAPSYAPIGEAFALGYTWNAAGVMIPFETFRQYGARRVLEENYPAMKRHIEGMMGMIAEGRSCLTSHIGFLGDHLSVTDTDPSLMDNAQYYRSVRSVERAAELLGFREDAEKFRDFGDRLREEWNRVFVGEDGRTRSAEGVLQDTQASYALPLVCGVFSGENLALARKHLKEACQRTDYTMTTGFMGTGPLLPALTEAGEIDTAYRMFEQTKCPSWLYPVLNGATSMWERWSSFTVENGFGGQNWMNSFNHYSLGAIGSWMMEFMAGIARKGDSGFGTFVLQPVCGGHFTSLEAAYESARGTIRSAWTARDGVMTGYECTVPANTRAELYLPAAENARVHARENPEGGETAVRNGIPVRKYQLPAGTYHFEIEMGKDA